MKIKVPVVKFIFVCVILSILFFSVIEYSPRNVVAKWNNIEELSELLQITYSPTQTSLSEGEVIVGDVDTVLVSSGTHITLYSGFMADTADFVQPFSDLVKFTTYLDGVLLPGAGYWGQASGWFDVDRDGDMDFGIDFIYDLGVLKPGIYFVRWVAPQHAPIQTYLNGDSIQTGPYDRSVTIVVEESPTLTPTVTQTQTQMPIVTSFPTLTSTPIPLIITPTRAAIIQFDSPGIINSPLKSPEDRYFNTQFRDSEPYVPEFTTNIPSPLDISLNPVVIGTNLFLAALMMIPFGFANELLDHMLKDYEEKRIQTQKSSRFLKKIEEWLSGNLSTNTKGRISLRDKLRILILILLYGLVFSLLDNSWKPLSYEGILLFISMAVIYGIVGLVDDFIQWKMTHRWNIPVRLKLKPLNLLVAIISIVTSRFLYLVPGLMFGTPQLMETDDEKIPKNKKNQLLKTSMITLTIIGLVAWSITILTSIVLQNSLLVPGIYRTIIAFFEAFLLIVFAVVVENFFIQMLGFPDSFGYMLKKSSRILWFIILIAITFIFIHTLINPQGDLMKALQKGNVIVFVGVVSSYLVIVLFSYLVFWLRKRKGGKGKS